MQAIYQPRGKAREYAELAVNLYTGCPHGCTYCYVPGIKNIGRSEYLTVSPRVGILDAIEKDARKMQGDPRHVLLCFMCDPYPPSDQKPFSVTREAIEILKRYKMRVAVLTKAGLRAMRDFDLLTPEDKFGCTLTFTDPYDSMKWEPGAELPTDRLFSLHAAHARGIPTWASLEPVIDPFQTIALISASFAYVDEFKVGKLNYLHTDIDWRIFCVNLAHQLNNFGCAYYIKDSLLPFWPDNMPRSYQPGKGD
jgi:DNA repair photolyase